VVRTITVRTAAEGTFSYERVLRGEIRAVEVQLGSGDTALTTPDVDITDDTYGTSILSEDGIAADSVYFPEAVCMGALRVEVTGAGADKRGRIRVLYD
jgi:hypothetical protein